VQYYSTRSKEIKESETVFCNNILVCSLVVLLCAGLCHLTPSSKVSSLFEAIERKVCEGDHSVCTTILAIACLLTAARTFTFTTLLRLFSHWLRSKQRCGISTSEMRYTACANAQHLFGRCGNDAVCMLGCTELEPRWYSIAKRFVYSCCNSRSRYKQTISKRSLVIAVLLPCV